MSLFIQPAGRPELVPVDGQYIRVHRNTSAAHDEVPSVQVGLIGGQRVTVLEHETACPALLERIKRGIVEGESGVIDVGTWLSTFDRRSGRERERIREIDEGRAPGALA